MRFEAEILRWVLSGMQFQVSGFRYGPVVQLVRTLACHARGRGFEPLPGRHFRGQMSVTASGLNLAQIAQSVEQWTENPRVAGSIPALGTNTREQRIEIRGQLQGRDFGSLF